jgi:YHS domain-containing protein
MAFLETDPAKAFLSSNLLRFHYNSDVYWLFFKSSETNPHPKQKFDKQPEVYIKKRRVGGGPRKNKLLYSTSKGDCI